MGLRAAHRRRPPRTGPGWFRSTAATGRTRPMPGMESPAHRSRRRAVADRPLLLLVNPTAGGKPAAPSSAESPPTAEELRALLAAGGRVVRLQTLRRDDEPGDL